MDLEKIIVGKRVLVVDDEQDVRDTLLDLLTDCKIDMASNFEQAKEMLQGNSYDIAVLDIMGVDGYGLLEIAKERKVPSVMLTAHALSEDNLLKSAKEGAAYYAPKEELINIKAILAEVLDAIEKEKSPWEKMFERLSDHYDKRFNGPNWREKEKTFWARRTQKYNP